MGNRGTVNITAVQAGGNSIRYIPEAGRLPLFFRFRLVAGLQKLGQDHQYDFHYHH